MRAGVGRSATRRRLERGVLFLLFPLLLLTVGCIPTFRNPITSSFEMADVAVMQHGGYYYMATSNVLGDLWVFRSRSISGLEDGEKRRVWRAPATGPNSGAVWAPSLSRLDNGSGVMKWYIHYGADDGSDVNKRMFALEAPDPFGPYSDKGQIFASAHQNTWSIDPYVLVNPTSCGTDPTGNYLVYSGAPTYLHAQNIYIARMLNPWTITGSPTALSTPTLSWEREGGNGTTSPYVNEAPRVLYGRAGEMHVIYSASGTWTPGYKLGRLTNRNGCVRSASAWQKSASPVFQRNDANSVYGTGVASFVKSPDANQDWMFFHASRRNMTPLREKSIRAQRLTWNSDGTPNLGTPSSLATALPTPSGDLPYGWGASGSGTSRSGGWAIGDGRSVSSTSLGATRARIFKQDMQVPETYEVSLQARLSEKGTTAAFPKYGFYPAYKDESNYVSVWIDPTSNALTTFGYVNGVQHDWQETFGLGINPADWHTLTVRKSGNSLSFLVDGALVQTRSFALSGGHPGLVTEDAKAGFRNLWVQSGAAPYGWGPYPAITAGDAGSWSLTSTGAATSTQISPFLEPASIQFKPSAAFESYAVGVRTRLDSDAAFFGLNPSYGLVAFYYGIDDNVRVQLDRVNSAYVTVGRARGVETRTATPLTNFNFNAFHRIDVVKSGNRFSFALDGVVRQTHTYDLVVTRGSVAITALQTRATFDSFSVR
jgi:GH43 family beta-xylosidase